jgi:hypothetical protein
MSRWLILSAMWQNAAAFLFRYTSITSATDFVGDLTRQDKGDFLLLLQPKFGFLPEAGRGRPKLLKELSIEDGANEAGQPVSRPLSRPSPTANLAGVWKGEPLNREVRGCQVHPNVKNQCGARCVHHTGATVDKGKGMLDAVYIGLTFGAFMAFLLYAIGCGKL